MVVSSLQEGILYFDSCPRCRGPLVLKNDWYGWYLDCLPCGYTRDIEVISHPANPPEPVYRSRVSELKGQHRLCKK